jgi:hypothetical protein
MAEAGGQDLSAKDMVADDVFFVLFCVGNLPILARPARKIKQEARLRRGSWLDDDKNQKKRASERKRC